MMEHCQFCGDSEKRVTLTSYDELVDGKVCVDCSGLYFRLKSREKWVIDRILQAVYTKWLRDV